MASYIHQPVIIRQDEITITMEMRATLKERRIKSNDEVKGLRKATLKKRWDLYSIFKNLKELAIECLLAAMPFYSFVGFSPPVPGQPVVWRLDMKSVI